MNDKIKLLPYNFKTMDYDTLFESFEILQLTEKQKQCVKITILNEDDVTILLKLFNISRSMFMVEYVRACRKLKKYNNTYGIKESDDYIKGSENMSEREIELKNEINNINMKILKLQAKKKKVQQAYYIVKNERLGELEKEAEERRKLREVRKEEKVQHEQEVAERRLAREERRKKEVLEKEYHEYMAFVRSNKGYTKVAKTDAGFLIAYKDVPEHLKEPFNLIDFNDFDRIMNENKDNAYSDLD